VKRFVVPICMSVIACGSSPTTTEGKDPADLFVGKFSGMASRVLSCPDPGPSAAGNISITFTKANASELSATAVIPADSVGGTTDCGPLTFTVIGSTATVKGMGSCVATESSLLLVHHTITSGTVTLAQGTANVTIKTAVVTDVSGGSSINCTAEANGKIAMQ
jgi:hypothetical protein